MARDEIPPSPLFSFLFPEEIYIITAGFDVLYLNWGRGVCWLLGDHVDVRRKMDQTARQNPTIINNRYNGGFRETSRCRRPKCSRGMNHQLGLATCSSRCVCMPCAPMVSWRLPTLLMVEGRAQVRASVSANSHDAVDSGTLGELRLVYII